MRLTNFTQDELADVIKGTEAANMENARRAAYKTGARFTTKCARCGTPFPYTPTPRPKLFCSLKCRVASHRLSRKKAIDNGGE